jgi:hypothetical protein
MKQFSPAANQALKEALTQIYWRKKDIRSFIYHTIQNKAIVSTIDWKNNVKNESIHILIDRMVARLDLYHNDLLRLFDAVMHFDDYSHLRQWDNPETKIRRAKESVAALRTHAQGYFVLIGGEDIIAVLDNRVSLKDLIYRKGDMQRKRAK